jgi:hypothetical protein
VQHKSSTDYFLALLLITLLKNFSFGIGPSSSFCLSLLITLLKNFSFGIGPSSSFCLSSSCNFPFRSPQLKPSESYSGGWSRRVVLCECKFRCISRAVDESALKLICKSSILHSSSKTRHEYPQQERIVFAEGPCTQYNDSPWHTNVLGCLTRIT